MRFPKRLAIAALIVVIDFAAFALPVTAIVCAYVIAMRPPQFLRWVIALYGDEGVAPGNPGA